jgi:transposase-like protein
MYGGVGGEDELSPLSRFATEFGKICGMTCPYCKQETGIGSAALFDTILMSRKKCERCGREFLIVNGVPNGPRAIRTDANAQLGISLILKISRNPRAATLGNTVAVVAKFYSHEWGKVRQHRTDAAIKAAW